MGSMEFVELRCYGKTELVAIISYRENDGMRYKHMTGSGALSFIAAEARETF
jgi:hypothetical protein